MNIRLRHLFGIAMASALILFIPSANAYLLQALPSVTDVELGDAFQVEIRIAGLEAGGLDEIVSAYHLDLSFTPGLVMATDVVFGDQLNLGNPLFSYQSTDLTGPNSVMLEELSILPDAMLAAAQPDSFVLASVGFEAIDVGAVSFDFLPYLAFGIDIKGRSEGGVVEVLPIETMGYPVTIHPRSIPETPAWMLLGIGLLVLIGQSRLQRGG